MVDDNRIINADVDDIDNLEDLDNKLNYDYWILEGYRKINGNNTQKFLHIIKLTRNKYAAKVGRGSEADVKVINSTVSRVHAIISLRNNQIYLSDVDSKFGTWSNNMIFNCNIALWSEPFELIKNQDWYIQIGRTLMNLRFVSNYWWCIRK